MRWLAFAVLALVPALALAQAPDPKWSIFERYAWPLGDDQIAEVDTDVPIPQAAGERELYARYYWPAMDKAQRVIRGRWQRFGLPGVVRDGGVPVFTNGSCGTRVDVAFYPDSRRYQVSCPGEAPFAGKSPPETKVEGILPPRDTADLWQPSGEQVLSLQKQVAPSLPQPLDRYVGLYSGVVIRGERYLQAHFLLQPQGAPAQTLVLGRALRPLQQEGCVVSAGLGETGQPQATSQSVRCTRPGAWTPRVEQIARLEQTLKLPAGADPLATYSRTYAGVTDHDRRLIRAKLVHGVGRAGAVIASDVELPIMMDGGCDNIDVTFDPTLSQSQVRCNGTPRPRDHTLLGAG